MRSIAFVKSARRARSFTLVELLTVMAVIAILAALTLQVSGFVQKKAAMARSESEIRAMEAACEGYKSDNGIYPRTSGSNTDSLDPRVTGNPSSYKPTSLYLYGELSGDQDAKPSTAATGKSYMEFKQDMLGWTTPSTHAEPVLYIADPWGNSYGYSTAGAAQIEAGSAQTKGYNPTFDLWSTAGNTAPPTPSTPTTDVTPRWMKNW